MQSVCCNNNRSCSLRHGLRGSSTGLFDRDRSITDDEIGFSGSSTTLELTAQVVVLCTLLWRQVSINVHIVTYIGVS